jgi:hypothetical protein
MTKLLDKDIVEKCNLRGFIQDIIKQFNKDLSNIYKGYTSSNQFKTWFIEIISPIYVYKYFYDYKLTSVIDDYTNSYFIDDKANRKDFYSVIAKTYFLILCENAKIRKCINIFIA